MPSDPDKKIEELLKVYAKKRREDAGAPLELHPATRNLLQAEVARLRPAPAAERASWLNALFGFWPRVAWAASMLVVAGVAVWLLNPRMEPTRQLANNVPASGPQSKTAALEDSALGDKEALRAGRNILLESDRDERSKLPVTELAGVAMDAASKPVERSRLAQAPPAAPAPPAAQPPPLATTAPSLSATPRAFGGGLVSTDAGQPTADLKRKAENRPAAMQNEAKSVQLAISDNTGTVFNDSATTVASGEIRYGLTPGASITSLGVTNQSPALGLAGADKYFYRTDNSPFVQSAATEKKLQTAQAEDQLALSKSKEPLARREVAAAETSAGKNVDRQSALRDQSSQLQAGKEEMRLATRFRSAAVSEKPAQSGTVAGGGGARFNRVNDASGKAGVAGPALLAAFEVEQAGDRIRLTDADGSVYEGQLIAGASDLNRIAGQAGLKQEPEKADALKAQAIQQKQSAPTAAPAQQSVSFRASGTNRSLNQLVVIDGVLMSATEATRGLAVKGTQTGPQFNAARLQVRIGPANQVEINATRVNP